MRREWDIEINGRRRVAEWRMDTLSNSAWFFIDGEELWSRIGTGFFDAIGWDPFIFEYQEHEFKLQRVHVPRRNVVHLYIDGEKQPDPRNTTPFNEMVWPPLVVMGYILGGIILVWLLLMAVLLIFLYTR